MRNHWFVAIQQNLATPAFANFPIVSVAARKSLETYPYHRSLRLSSSPLMLLSVLHRFSSTKHSLMEAERTQTGVISRLPSSFHMNTLIVVRFKICTVNVTKLGTIRYLAYYPHHGGQTLPKKDRERKY